MRASPAMEIERRVFQELGRHEAQEQVDLDLKYRRLRNFFALCESPLEQLFLFYVLDYCPHRLAHCSTGYDAETMSPALRCAHWDLEEHPNFSAKIVAQHRVNGGQYRADLFIELSRARRVTEPGDGVTVRLLRSEVFARLVVELDGHDFHERTREQARRDRSRDRYLLASGYTVFRFTGSEIFRNPYRAVAEVDNYLAGVMRKAERGELLPLASGECGLLTNVKLVTRFFRRPYGRKALRGF